MTLFQTHINHNSLYVFKLKAARRRRRRHACPGGNFSAWGKVTVEQRTVKYGEI